MRTKKIHSNGSAGNTVDEGDDEFSGFPSCLGHGHRAGVTEGGVADTPAEGAAKTSPTQPSSS